ncbi:MAG: hypothetical protein L3J49_12685 [Desulfobulbaceae bacterium]|nr:hypothetical protein [Desulfobulbaceae bacterium]
MSIDKDSLENLDRLQKKELLSALVASLLHDLSENEKKNLLQNIVSSGGDNLQVIDMVEH